MPIEEVNLRMQFQRHNLDLANWRRAMIIALTFNLPNKEMVFDRLAREPLDTAAFMSTYFGQDNANRYIEIMYQRIYNYRSMVEAMITGDQADVDTHFQKLMELGDRLADFFYELSPVYTRDEWGQLLKQYEQLMHDQAEAVVTGNYNAEIELSDRIVEQITAITEHVATVIAVALGWSSGISGGMPAPGTALPAPGGTLPSPGSILSAPEVRVTTAIWRFPGH